MRLGTPSGTQSLASYLTQRNSEILNGTPKNKGTPKKHSGTPRKTLSDMTTETLDLKWNTLSADQKQKAFDLLHSDNISKGTKAALDKLKKTRKIGRPPYGYKYHNGKLVNRMDESVTMSRMLELREAGCNYTLISKTLNLEGSVSQTGKPFTPQMVRNIIQRTLSHNS